MKFAFVLFLLFLVIVLSVKQILIKQELKNINIQLNEILNNDTNANITVSANDKTIKETVSALNSNIRAMRKKELQIKSKNDEISTAITNISHDLRTPLTAINGYTDMIKGSNNIEDIKQYSAIISERAKSMSMLTEELFRYSMVLSNKKLELEEVCLQTELEKALAASYTLIAGKNIKPQINIAEKPVFRYLNKDALSRIFSNILSNAAKYSDGDLFVNLSENGIIEILNTSKALDEVQASRLFDRFYTVSNGRESTGIGLSIAKYLTEEMGGKISSAYSDNKLTIHLKFN